MMQRPFHDHSLGAAAGRLVKGVTSLRARDVRADAGRHDPLAIIDANRFGLVRGLAPAARGRAEGSHASQAQPDLGEVPEAAPDFAEPQPTGDAAAGSLEARKPEGAQI